MIDFDRRKTEHPQQFDEVPSIAVTDRPYRGFVTHEGHRLHERFTVAVVGKHNGATCSDNRRCEVTGRLGAVHDEHANNSYHLRKKKPPLVIVGVVRDRKDLNRGRRRQ